MRADKKILPLLAMCCLSCLVQAGQYGDRHSLERGRYLVLVGGCNDCHTAGFAEAGGQVAEKDWLTGSPVGFQGPWGTTYAGNLRLTMQAQTEAGWLKQARTAMRPPMPSPSLMAMSDSDLKAVYRFIRSLSPVGNPAPAYVPPGVRVTTPYFDFVPKNLPKQAAAK